MDSVAPGRGCGDRNPATYAPPPPIPFRPPEPPAPHTSAKTGADTLRSVREVNVARVEYAK